MWTDTRTNQDNFVFIVDLQWTPAKCCANIQPANSACKRHWPKKRSCSSVIAGHGRGPNHSHGTGCGLLRTVCSSRSLRSEERSDRAICSVSVLNKKEREHARKKNTQAAIRAAIRRQRRNEGVQIVAGCDLRADAREWISTRLGTVRTTSDVEDRHFWEAVDCVVGCATPQVHEVLLARGLIEGKHCFCEKPAGVSSRSLRELAQRMPRGARSRNPGRA